MKSTFLAILMFLAAACTDKHSPPCTTTGGVRGQDGGEDDDGGGTGSAGSTGGTGRDGGAPDSGTGSVDAIHVTGEVMPCAGITLTIVAPVRVETNADVPIVGSASDDTGEDLTLSWSTDDGNIADRASAMTTFTCTHAGSHALTLTALSSHACTGAAVHVVTCVDPPQRN